MIDLKIMLDLHLKWLKDEEGGQKANLEGADLEGADLEGADLKWADLEGADLEGADLKGANLDFSCLPLWCGSFNMKVDDRLVTQILGHLARLNVDACSEPVKTFLRTIPDDMANTLCKRHDIDPVVTTKKTGLLKRKTTKKE